MSGQEVIVAIIVGSAALSLVWRFVKFFKKSTVPSAPHNAKAGCDKDCSC